MSSACSAAGPQGPCGAVHRPVQPWTPTVHALLRHLKTVGFAGAPRVLGVDGQGREVLTQLDGGVAGEELPWPAWVRSETALRQVGAWARRLHDVTRASSRHSMRAGSPDRRGGPDRSSGTTTTPHRGTWSGATGASRVSSNWDTAGPSTREFDLTFTALTWVPLHARGFAERTGFTAFENRSRRLHLLRDAYGYEGDRLQFQAVVAQRARTNADVIRRMAADGDPVYTAL
ncbi:hypothetical protein [Streptomyces sp. NPDC051993]|uniref:hypothetical protein n=1 Tax=Streptomyces sp. NPDC051993 TaxID=3155286 RepID=UPI00344495C2